VPSAAIQQVLSGKVKALAVSGRARLPALPQVPTFDEAGMRGFDVSTWYGFIGPAGMPRAIVDNPSRTCSATTGLFPPVIWPESQPDWDVHFPGIPRRNRLRTTRKQQPCCLANLGKASKHNRAEY